MEEAWLPERVHNSSEAVRCGRRGSLKLEGLPWVLRSWKYVPLHSLENL